jgi:glycosyltransferase involved in cell wall biosynthesis
LGRIPTPGHHSGTSRGACRPTHASFRPRRPVLNILLLCEGDARTRDSWSGVSKSVVENLEALGHRVTSCDVDLYGARKLWTAVQSTALTRRRWWVRYHLGPAGFAARSEECARHVAAHRGAFDVVLQIGATFRVPDDIGVPVVLYCDSSIELARAGRGSGYSDAAFLDEDEIAAVRAREADVYAHATRIVTMSHQLRESFIRDFGLDPRRLVTVHVGPNVSIDDAERPADAATAPPTILFVGRDFGRKGGDVLVQAFSKVRARLPNARLRMIGSVPGDAPEGVEFVPFQSRDTPGGREAMDRAYRTADVFCIPTRFEPFGTSFVEAMLYGLPCVGPRAWAVPEIIVDGETGILATPEDPDSYAEALARLLLDRDLARAMGRAGRTRAVAEFSWSGVASKIRDALEASRRESSVTPNPP